MALVVEDGTGKSNADSYDSVANCDTYLRDFGHVGTAQERAGLLLKGSLAANATSLSMDGMTAADEVLKGDRFIFDATPGEYKFTRGGVADSTPEILSLTFTPAVPVAVSDNSAITILGTDDGRLRRATQFLDTEFGLRLKGRKSNSDQALLWPRYGMSDSDGFSIDSDSIPTRWKQAMYEASLIVGTNRKVSLPALIKSVKAGTAEVEFGGKGRSSKAVYDFIRGLVSIYLQPVRVVRA